MSQAVIAGMRHVNFDLDLQFDDPRAKWLSEQILAWNLMILTLRNYFYLQENPGCPHLYDADVAYLKPEQLERRPSESAIRDLRQFLSDRMKMTRAEIQHHTDLARGVEIFRDIPRIREHGGGDCDNLACWRAAELAVANVDARPYLRDRQQDGRIIYHALVKWHTDGSAEDPSLILGMGDAAKAAERLEECRKNYERYDNYWQDAKHMLATEGGGAARAAELKAKIDSLGLLPESGVFRVPQRAASGHASTQTSKKRSWWRRLAA